MPLMIRGAGASPPWSWEVEEQGSNLNPPPRPVEAPPIVLAYHAITPPKRSGFSYFWVVVFALIRLFVGAVLAIAGLLMLIGGGVGIVSAQPDTLGCAGVVWGPILMLLGVHWFRRAIEILMAGRDYNPHY